MTQPIIERKQSLKPELRFTPYAWAKLLFMCHTRDTEVSGMGIGAENNPLLIEDILIIKQRSSSAFTKFDADDYAARMVELCDPEGEHKFAPQRCQRVWIHTHPAGVSRPSMTDDETFDEAFGLADWAIMFIYSKSEDVYCQLRMTSRNTNGSSTELRQEIPVDIAWGRAFPAADPVAWKAELDAMVNIDMPELALSEPLSAIGVMPTVRTGVVYAPEPKLYNGTWLSDAEPSNRGGRRPQTAGKSRLVPISGSLLSGLSSQQLTRLLMSDISKESLHSGNTGSIIQKLQKNGWELYDLSKDETYVDDIPLQKSSVYFVNKALSGHFFGNRDLAWADRMVMLANQSEENKQALEAAEFDLQAVVEDRALGEVGQRDSFGFDLEAVFPWHVPGRALLFISLNELEDLLLVLKGDDKQPEPVQAQKPLHDQHSIRTYIQSAWAKLQVMGVSAVNASREILKGIKLSNPSLSNPHFQDVLEDWIVQEIEGQLPTPESTNQEDTQEVEPPASLVESQDMRNAKNVFREVLTQAKSEGWSVQEIDVQFAHLYDKALQGRWQEEFVVVLKHVRAHGYDVTCLDKPVETIQETFGLTGGEG